MSDNISSLDEFDMSELSEEDLVILQAFEAMETWPTRQLEPKTYDQHKTHQAPQGTSIRVDEEMLLIFLTEVDGDISSIRETLNLLEQFEPDNLALFTTLKRVSHKLYGTSGAVGFPLLSTIAAQIELLAEEVPHGTLSAYTGTRAISAATTALEACLQTITATKQEPEATSLLASLEVAYQSLQVDLQQLEQKRAASEQIDSRSDKHLESTLEVHTQRKQTGQDWETIEAFGIEEALVHISTEDLPQGSASLCAPPSLCTPPSLHIDAQRFERLTACTEKLVEQRATVENAQARVECTLQELYIAQTRLQRLAPLISTLQEGNMHTSSLPERTPDSSLIARILQESLSSNRHHPKHATSPANSTRLLALEYMNKKVYPVSNAQWDELEIDNYNEQDLMIHIFKDAMDELANTTANVQSAFTDFLRIQQSYLESSTHVHRNTLLLHQAPFRTVVPRLERVVAMSALGQAQHIHFDVTGKEIEIDQDILNTLTKPLIHLLRTCLADPVTLAEITPPVDKDAPLPPHIWMKVINHGKHLTFEIGFSMPIQGGTIETIREPIEQLHGTISLQRNSVGGCSFFLHVPHMHSNVICLLVQAGNQHLLIPFNQIQRISNDAQEQTDVCYSLQELLSFPSGASPEATDRHLPLLILSSEDGTIGRETVGITVDEILGEQECIVKPLSSHLQRPGIAGTTIDGKGHVLLIVDLLALIRSAPYYISSPQTLDKPLSQPERAKILVTDDSTTLRRSLTQTLQKASYRVFEAHDGVEALEQLRQHKPDICLLDIEMPNLNGYDVLQIMSTNPSLSDIKVIMLTSRGAIKYMQHALNLGARAYLTKPCAQDDLFQTIEYVLKEPKE